MTDLVTVPPHPASSRGCRRTQFPKYSAGPPLIAALQFEGGVYWAVFIASARYICWEIRSGGRSNRQVVALNRGATVVELGFDDLLYVTGLDLHTLHGHVSLCNQWCSMVATVQTLCDSAMQSRWYRTQHRYIFAPACPGEACCVQLPPGVAGSLPHPRRRFAQHHPRTASLLEPLPSPWLLKTAPCNINARLYGG